MKRGIVVGCFELVFIIRWWSLGVGATDERDKNEEGSLQECEGAFTACLAGSFLFTLGCASNSEPNDHKMLPTGLPESEHNPSDAGSLAAAKQYLGKHDSEPIGIVACSSQEHDSCAGPLQTLSQRE
jgi:hypothetical protein